MFLKSFGFSTCQSLELCAKVLFNFLFLAFNYYTIETRIIWAFIFCTMQLKNMQPCGGLVSTKLYLEIDDY